MARRKKSLPAQEKIADIQVSTALLNETPPEPNDTPVANETASKSAESTQLKDGTRHKLAMIYIKTFLGIIGGTLAFMLIGCYSVTDIKDVLLAESGILSGPLGFIIGFYFKEELSTKE